MLKSVLTEVQIKEVLGLEANFVLDHQAGLMSMGMDSLLAIKFKNELTKALGSALTQPLRATLIFNYPNIEALSQYFLTRFSYLKRRKLHLPLDITGQMSRLQLLE